MRKSAFFFYTLLYYEAVPHIITGKLFMNMFVVIPANMNI